MRRCRPAELFRLFLGIGAFTFGGGMAMIPLIRRALVEERRLVSDEEFLECIALTQCAPGPITGNLAVLLGYRLAGWAGAGAAVVGGSLPALLVIMVIAWQYTSWRNQVWANQVFSGLRPAIVVLVAYSALRMSQATIRTPLAGIIYGGSLIALVVAKLHPLVVILAAFAIAIVRWTVFRYGSNGESEGNGDVC
jgi:chromate transporter